MIQPIAIVIRCEHASTENEQRCKMNFLLAFKGKMSFKCAHASMENIHCANPMRKSLAHIHCAHPLRTSIATSTLKDFVTYKNEFYFAAAKANWETQAIKSNNAFKTINVDWLHIKTGSGVVSSTHKADCKIFCLKIIFKNEGGILNAKEKICTAVMHFFSPVGLP